MISELHSYPVYRPSGVPWLGAVPEHWEVRRVGMLAQILNGATPSTSNASYWDGDIVWITPDDLGKLNCRYVTGSARRITEEGYRACGTNLAPAGSIAISTRAPIGHLGVLRSDACVNQGCRLLVPDDAGDTEYLHYALSTTTSTLASFGQGSTFTELSRTLLAAFQLPIPPLPEQAAIVHYLDYRGPSHPAVRQCQAEAHRPAGGGEAGHRQPSRHPGPGPQRPPQAPPASSGSATCRSIGKCGG